MQGAGVGKREAEDIDLIVDRLLRDLGNPTPPLSLATVREALKLDLHYYSSAEQSIVEEVVHRVRVGVKQIALRPGLIVDAIRKARLSALWMPDAKRILIDDAVPKLKHRWIEAHEIGHSIIPWHAEFLFGDTEFTLDPLCHAMVEAEANYAAGQLIFLRKRFAQEARDLDLSFNTIKALAKRYGNTITTSLWRIVEERDAGVPVFGMVSAHPQHPEIGRGATGRVVRSFIKSPAFHQRFGTVAPGQIYAILRDHAQPNRIGTVVDCTADLTDVAGEHGTFRIESFSNGHALLTFGEMIRRRTLQFGLSRTWPDEARPIRAATRRSG